MFCETGHSIVQNSKIRAEQDTLSKGFSIRKGQLLLTAWNYMNK